MMGNKIKTNKKLKIPYFQCEVCDYITQTDEEILEHMKHHYVMVEG